MRGGTLFDRWLKKYAPNAAAWCRDVGLDPTYVCHLRKRRRVPSLRVALVIERETGIPARTWMA